MSSHPYPPDARLITPNSAANRHKLISITALYHFDTDAGLRVTVTDENNTLDTLDAFHQVIVEKYDELWADAITQFKHQELLDVFRHKLSQIAHRKPPKK